MHNETQRQEMMMRLTIKNTTRTGKLAHIGTEKQIKFANEIIVKINEALDEIEKLNCGKYADLVADELDKCTDMVAAGPCDVIDYLRNVGRKNIIEKCIQKTRTPKRDDNDRAANKKLNELLEAEYQRFNNLPVGK